MKMSGSQVRRCFALMCVLVVLAACDSQTEALPTQMDLNAISTNDAATIQVVTQAAVDLTATRVADATRNAPPTLPPTWTPEPVVTQPAADVALPTAAAGIVDRGTLFFVFNGDSVAMLEADGSAEDLIDIGGAPSHLTLSPDGQYLGYVKQGSGSAREVFIIPLNAGNDYQPLPVSCVGYGRIAALAWSADSKMIAFAASPSSDGQLGIFTAGIFGGGQCPTGNNQRMLVQTTFNAVESMAWNDAGTYIFLSSNAVYGVDVSNGTLYPPLTRPTGFGPDFNLSFRTGTTDLYYFKTERNDRTGETGGLLTQASTAEMTEFPLQELRGTPYYGVHMRFSPDGRHLVAATVFDAFVQDMTINTATQVVRASSFPPQPVFSPDGEMVAYVDTGRTVDPVPQVWIVSRKGEDRRLLTNHQEGTISYLNWAP